MNKIIKQQFTDDKMAMLLMLGLELDKRKLTVNRAKIEKLKARSIMVNGKRYRV